MSKTDYAENKVLELLVGKTAFATPTVYVALFTAAPSDAGGGTEVSTTGTGYARKLTAAADWGAASAGSLSNAAAITFATATGSYGPVTHWALMDAVTAGNMLRWAILGTAKSFVSGDIPQFAIGALVCTED